MRLLGLEEIPHALRQALGQLLRVSDEATVLPSASRSTESGAFKNVVMRLSGTDGELNPDLFSSNWFTGVSLVEVDAATAEGLLRDAGRRARLLKTLASKVPSELADSETQIGPELDGDEHDRDKEGWVCGFDGSACCVGLYSARQSRSPETGKSGMDRAHNAYFLVARAGGGLAAQTFHSRLTTALRKGKSLDEALESGTEPGPAALRRVASAAARNRQRLLLLAAETLGFHTLDSLSDNAAAPSSPSRGAVTIVDVSSNSLRRLDGARSMWQYSAGCVDSAISQGLVVSSNPAEGFVAFTDTNDKFKTAVRNEALNCVPFSTLRLSTTRDVAMKAAERHKKARAGGTQAHPDHQFLQERFAWKPKTTEVKVEPPGLWGSHGSEQFLANWGRELGLATLKQVRLSPELVCVAALEPAKLRAASKFVVG